MVDILNDFWAFIYYFVPAHRKLNARWQNLHTKMVSNNLLKHLRGSIHLQKFYLCRINGANLQALYMIPGICMTSIRVVWVPALDRFVTFHINGTQPPQQRPLSKPKPKLPPASALSAAGTMKLTTRSLDSASSGWQNAASVQAPF